MEHYVAMLRGINVGSKNRIAMPELKKAFEEAGFADVRTYVQSGNVIFSTQTSSANLESEISAMIKQSFGHKVPVVVRSAKELAQITAENPFLKKPGIDPAKLHVTFLSGKPAPGLEDSVKMPDDGRGDEWIIVGRDIYLHCPVDYGHTKLTNAYLEKKLKVGATTRNWKSVNALVELASKP